jgi:hypothetical protein
MVATFCAGSEAWFEGAQGLENLVKGGIDTLTLPTLSSALFEHRCLGISGDFIETRDNIGLGDVGYMDDNGCFVTVGNLHTHLMSPNGALLTWEQSHPSQRYCNENSLIVDHLGQSYTRQVPELSGISPAFFRSFLNHKQI